MLSVMTTRARPGMTLAMPVFHPHHAGHVLLKPGCVLDAPMILRLIQLRLHAVWITYPGLEDVVRYVSPEIVRAHAHLTRVLGNSLDRLVPEAHANLDFSLYADAVKSLVSKLGEEPSRQLLVSEIATSDSLTAHASNVCFLSLLMGLKLEAYLISQRSKLPPAHARCVENLGVGALLHDIGLLHLDPEVAQRYEQTGDDTDEAWRAHVELGVQACHGRIEPSALAVIAQHHQRFDGRGFPAVHTSTGPQKTIAGNDIHVFARIAHVADLFDQNRNSARAAARNRGQRPPAVRVLYALVKRARRREIDPVVVKGLVAVVPAFAPGSVVTLCNGARCAVVGFDPLSPCRPVVQPIADHAPRLDEPPAAPRIDLREHLDLSIAEAEGQAVTDDLFAPETTGEFDLRCASGYEPRQPAAAGRR